MNQGFGGESPRGHSQQTHRKATRYLVTIDAGGLAVAKLFLDTRELVAEFDASTEETVSMTEGRSPSRGAAGPEWDRALAGHTAAERAAADVYVLDI